MEEHYRDTPAGGSAERTDAPAKKQHKARAPRGEKAARLSEKKTSKARARGKREIEWPELKNNRAPEPLSPANVSAFLEAEQAQLRFNSWTNQTEVSIDGAAYEPMTDATETAMRMRMLRDGCKVSKEFFRDRIGDIAAAEQFDPMLQYFAELPAWDRTPRASTIWVRHGGAPNTAIVRTMSLAWLIGAVARLHEPGVKFDNILVLEGAQKLAKSMALAKLCPFPSCFTDGLVIGAEAKIIIEQTAGKWIIELAELAALEKSAIEVVKAFASRQVDRARRVWGTYASDVPRRFALAATYNPDASKQYLLDGTGGRRFWPIEITRKINIDALVAEREQIWAEALHHYRKGTPHYLTDEQEDEAGKLQAARLVDDPWADLLSGNLEGRVEVTVNEAWAILKIDAAKQSPTIGKRLTNVMASIGFRRKSVWVGGKEKKSAAGYKRVTNADSS